MAANEPVRRPTCSSIDKWAARVLEAELSKTGARGGMNVAVGQHEDSSSSSLMDMVSAAKRRLEAVDVDVNDSKMKNAMVSAEYESLGDAQMSRIETYQKKLDSKGIFPRSLKQKELHKVFTCAMMHLVYGQEEFRRRCSELQLRYNVKEFGRLVACSMPRRFGKTQSVAMHNAVCLLSFMKPLIIDVFSTGRRASKLLLNLTYSVIVKLEPNAASSVTVHNVEMLTLEDQYTKSEKTVNSYPGGVCAHTHILVLSSSLVCWLVRRSSLFF
jgi:hypothetical protein